MTMMDLKEDGGEYNTINDSLVGVQGDVIVVGIPRARLSRAEALRLAAWLVVIADEGDDFDGLLEAVTRT